MPRYACRWTTVAGPLGQTRVPTGTEGLDASWTAFDLAPGAPDWALVGVTGGTIPAQAGVVQLGTAATLTQARVDALSAALGVTFPGNDLATVIATIVDVLGLPLMPGPDGRQVVWLGGTKVLDRQSAAARLRR